MEYYHDKEEAWKRQIVTSSDHSEAEAIAAIRHYVRTRHELPEPAQQPGRFEVFSTITLAHPSKLYRRSCCPDKDLIVIVSRSGNRERVALWKLQGSKKWEVEVSKHASSEEERVVSLAWDPSGRHIVLAHHPPRLTLHALDSGREEHSVPFSPSSPTAKLSQLWWLPISDGTSEDLFFPDILRRNGRAPGSAQSLIAQMVPLDLVSDESGISNAETFILGVSSPRRMSGQTNTRSNEFERWPTLLDDLYPSSSKLNFPKDGEAHHRAKDFKHCSTLLIAADSSGNTQFFVDGTFPVGRIQLTPVPSTSAWLKATKNSRFLVHCGIASQTQSTPTLHTLFCPSSVALTLLDGQEFRFVAQTSSSLRHLLWHCRKFLTEMRNLWIGQDGREGVGSIGPRWLKSIEVIQRENWGYNERRGALELTILLVTGQASQPLSGILAGGESTSDRKLARWESTVTEALVTIRDFAEKRLQPALQRVYILVEEVKAWTSTPERFAGYSLSTLEIEGTLNLVESGIYLSTWLAAAARDELNQFKNFVQWVRFETQRIQTAISENANNLLPKHDPIEVNKYLISGLSKSEIDSFFEGPPPDERLLDFFRGRITPLNSTMAHTERYIKFARTVCAEEAGHSTSYILQTFQFYLQISIQDSIAFRRNLLPLIESVISKCSSWFQKAALAVTKTAICHSITPVKNTSSTLEISKYFIKDWLEWELNMEDSCSMGDYFVAYAPSDNGANLLCIFYSTFSTDRSEIAVASVSVSMNACVPKFMDASRHQYMILDFDILNEDYLVIVIRNSKRQGGRSRPYLALVPWRDPCMKYEPLRIVNSVSAMTTREEAIKLAIQLVRETQLSLKPLPLKRMHELSSLSKSGPVTLVCNGKRKVACVLDENGTVESLDLSTEPEQFEFEFDLSMQEEERHQNEREADPLP